MNHSIIIVSIQLTGHISPAHESASISIQISQSQNLTLHRIRKRLHHAARSGHFLEIFLNFWADLLLILYVGLHRSGHPLPAAAGML